MITFYPPQKGSLLRSVVVLQQENPRDAFRKLHPIWKRPSTEGDLTIATLVLPRPALCLPFESENRISDPVLQYSIKSVRNQIRTEPPNEKTLALGALLLADLFDHDCQISRDR
jgi:hypothetical protein